MSSKKAYLQLLICYLFWGFQPFYWNLNQDIDPFTLIALRAIFVSLYTTIFLATRKKLVEVKNVITDWKQIKYLLGSSIFLAGDWIVFLLAVRNSHVLDTSLGYYIVPLLVFILGVCIYREKCGTIELIAFLVAFIGVLISAISFGKIPILSLAIAFIWSSYITVKKNVNLDGILSTCIESSILSIAAIIFLVMYRMPEVIHIFKTDPLFILGSGLVTGLPLLLYSNAILKIPMIALGFCQYLSPTLNVICGFMMGEHFSKDQLISLSFFVISIIIFSISEIKKQTRQKA